MAFAELTSKNFSTFAYENYRHPGCADLDEFYEDLQRFKYLKKLMNGYLKTARISERLLLNHLITLTNVFGIEATKKMLEYKMEREHWPIMKPCLQFLNYIRPDEYSDVVSDPLITEALGKI